MTTVREHSDLMHDPAQKEALIGRVFGILGVRNAEMVETEAPVYKYRVVFQGNNVHTKSGVSAVDLYQEVSNAPASFTAIRSAVAVAILTRKKVTVRDALQAFLQAHINTPGRVPTWAELPQAWWPDEWFYDGATRKKPKYRRPVVLLILALYGHPEAGALWDALLVKILGSLGWKRIPEWPGVFVHPDSSS